MAREPEPAGDPAVTGFAGRTGDDAVVGEPRWPMAGAVVAVIVLTLLLPDSVRLGPRWLLPIIEGMLLVAVIVGDPGRITRRSRLLRAISITLVSVLVLASLWATGQLIDDLIHGGPETNSASDLLEAGSLVWVSNNIAFALLYWELDGGGAAARAHHAADHLDLAFPQQLNPLVASPNWQPRFNRLPVSRVHQRDGLQPDRRDAAGAVGEDHDGCPGGGLARNSRTRRRPSCKHLHVARRLSPRTGPGSLRPLPGIKATQ